MEALTGIDLRGWALVGALLVGCLIIFGASSSSTAGTRLRGLLVVPLVGGALMVGGLLLAYGPAAGRLPALIVGRPAAIVTAAAVGLLALAVVDFLFRRAVPLAARALTGLRPPTLGGDVAMAVVLSLVTGVILAGFDRLDTQRRASGAGPFGAPGGEPVVDQAIELLSSMELAGNPADIALEGEHGGYISLAEGSILRFEVPSEPGGEMHFETVADGLANPRGLAVKDGTLYAVELGPLPCQPAKPLCRGNDLSPDSRGEGELQILASTRARVQAREIRADGSLGDARTVLDDLPVVASDHAVNGMTLGSDGAIYLAVGNVDGMWRTPERAAEVTPHADWLGTILRLAETTGPPAIVARGLRNVYKVAFDDEGRMWAVDNDGFAQDGWRAEEVLQIKEGRNYGYPQEATFGEKTIRTDQPVWISPHQGSAGVAWLADESIGPGLLIGSCGQLSLLRAADGGPARPRWEMRLTRNSMIELLSGLGGCVTSVQPLPSGEVLAGLYSFGDTGVLYNFRPAPEGQPAQ
jgi:hypothetical protein